MREEFFETKMFHKISNQNFFELGSFCLYKIVSVISTLAENAKSGILSSNSSGARRSLTPKLCREVSSIQETEQQNAMKMYQSDKMQLMVLPELFSTRPRKEIVIVIRIQNSH